LKTKDEECELYPKKKEGEIEDGYYVYDDIWNGNESEKRYNIARIENKADNPYIRFRIEGGWNKGLFIRFSRFDDDELITKFQIMTYFSEEKYENAGLAWSSSLYRLKPE
jgi:hypothetical protein